MLKKLKNYLLEHYPLLWNMRLVNVLAIIIIFHLVHLLIGYISYSEDVEYYRNPESVYFTTSFFSFSLIGSATIFILWLIRVFRNNAFKSFYPTTNRQLFVQFNIILLVCLLNISYYYIYTFGYVCHARITNNFEDNENDIKIYNKALGLLEQNIETYAVDKKQYPKPFPLVKKYTENKSNNESDFYYEDQEGQKYSSAQVDSLVGGVKYSYLNYQPDYRYIETHNENTQSAPQEIQGIDGGIFNNGSEYLNQKNADFHKLLQKPDELKRAMEDFIKLCQRHNIKHRFDADQWFKWVYNPPFYPVKYTIRQYYSYGNDDYSNQLNPKGYFVELTKLQSKLTRTNRSYEYNFEPGAFCGFLYVALGMTILIFSFRVTSRRVWLISFIGSFLIVMLVGAFTALFGMAMRNNGSIFLFTYLLIIFGFLAGHLLSNQKNVSGAMLNWFSWSLPFVSLIIIGLIEIADKADSVSSRSWIETHGSAYFFLFFICYILITAFMLVPLYKKWQAMPED